MILVLGGTKEAVELNKKLNAAGLSFITTVVSDYGAQLTQNWCDDIIKGNLDEKGLIRLIDDKGINVIIDMTHPYAEQISKLACHIAKQMNIPYYRYQRPETNYQDPLVEKVDSYAEAAKKAVRMARDREGSVFLTIGSRRIQPFIEEAQKSGVRLICRVLPDAGVLEQLFSAGLTAKDVVAVLGPFSHDLNKAMFTHYKAGVVVTKDAGIVGGTDTKISAALELRIPLLVIKRPGIDADFLFHDIEDILRRVTDNE